MRTQVYASFFGLREQPFGLTPDTSYFFPCVSYQEALNTLLLAARNGEGFIKITGEVGTGKTLLCRTFLKALGQETGPAGQPRFVTAYIPNPYLEPRSLLLALAEELRAPLERDVDQHKLLKGITRALLGYARDGRRVVLCMDEAQAMPVETLESLRLLTNLETEKRKLLQVVLFGQPELDQRLAGDSVRQLRQRIGFHYHLAPLARDELEHYLAHRLAVAGYQGPALFERSAVSALHRASGGVPRLVNVIAHKALMLAFGEGARRVRRSHVRGAAGDTPAARTPLRWWWYVLPLAAVAAVGIPMGLGL